MKKAFPYIFLALIAIAVIFIRKCRTDEVIGGRKAEHSKSYDRNRGFDRRTSYLEYTKHAKCRMECRQITTAEVEEVMRNGNINYRKTDVNARPCPTYALEGYTRDNQHVRIIFAQCDQTTRVITSIDLDKEWQCDCPGDERKYKNRGN